MTADEPGYAGDEDEAHGRPLLSSRGSFRTWEFRAIGAGL